MDVKIGDDIQKKQREEGNTLRYNGTEELRIVGVLG